jgi:hypothetical protein
MTLYLLNHFSTLELVLLIVGGSALLAIAAAIAVGRRSRA